MAGPARTPSAPPLRLELTFKPFVVQQQSAAVDSASLPSCADPPDTRPSTGCASATPCATTTTSSVAVAAVASPRPLHPQAADPSFSSVPFTSSLSHSNSTPSSTSASAASSPVQPDVPHALTFPPQFATPRTLQLPLTSAVHPHQFGPVPAIYPPHPSPVADLLAHYAFDPAPLSPAVFPTPSLAPVSVDVPDWARLSPTSITPPSLSPALVVDDSLEALFFGGPGGLEPAGSHGVIVSPASHGRDPTRFAGETIRSGIRKGSRAHLERKAKTPTATAVQSRLPRQTELEAGRIQDQTALKPMPVMAKYSHSAWLAAVSASEAMPSLPGLSGGGQCGPGSSGSPLQTETTRADPARREQDDDRRPDPEPNHAAAHQHPPLSAKQQPDESVQHGQLSLARRPSLPSIQSILSDKSTTPSPPLHLGAAPKSASDYTAQHGTAPSQLQMMADIASHLADRRSSLLSLIETASTLSSPSPTTLPARTIWSPPPPSDMPMLHSSTSSLGTDAHSPPTKRLRTMSYPSAASAASALAAVPLSSGRPLPPPYLTGTGSAVGPLQPGGNERPGSVVPIHDQHTLPPPPPQPPARFVALGSRGKSIDFGTLFSLPTTTPNHAIPQAQAPPHPQDLIVSHQPPYQSSQPTAASHLAATSLSTSKPKKRAASGNSATSRGTTSTRRPSKSHVADSLSIIPTTALGVPMPRVRGGRGRGRSGADEPSLPHPKDFFSAVLKSKDTTSGPPTTSSSVALGTTSTGLAQPVLASPRALPTSMSATVVPPLEQQYQAHLASVLPGSPPPGATASQQQQVTLLGRESSGSTTAMSGNEGRGDSSVGANVQQSFPMLTSGVNVNFVPRGRTRQDGPLFPAQPKSTMGTESSLVSQHQSGASSTVAGRRPTELSINIYTPTLAASHLPSPFTTAPLGPPPTWTSSPSSPADTLDHLNRPETQSPLLSPSRPHQVHSLAPHPTVPAPSKAMFHVTSSLNVVHVTCDPMPHDFASTPVLHNFSLEALQSQLSGRPISDLLHPADAYPILGLPMLRTMYIQQQQHPPGQPGPPASWSWSLRVCDGTRGYKPAKVKATLTEAGRQPNAVERTNEAVWLVTIDPDTSAGALTSPIVVNGITPFPSPVGGASASAAEASQYAAFGPGSVGGGASGQHVRGQQYLV